MRPENYPDITRRIETDRFGPFTFQTGVAVDGLELALQRVEDAHERFTASPLAQVASRLEKEVVVSSVFGTNTIEGGTLTEDETADALALDPAQTRESNSSARSTSRPLTISRSRRRPGPAGRCRRASSSSCTASSARMFPIRTTGRA
jgi:hypothetical protein